MIKYICRMIAVTTVRSNVKKRCSQSSSGSNHHESESGVTAQLVAVYDGYGRVTSASHIELSFR
jgi:hypothetical protein